MITVQVAGVQYRVGRMNAMSQFHVGRRVAPLLFALGAAGVGMLGKEPPSGEDGDGLKAFVPMIAPVAQVLSQMTDTESEYVIAECLQVVEREVSSGRWGPMVSTDAGARLAHRMLFSDVDMRIMLRLVLESLKENLGDFWRGLESEAAHESSAGEPQP